MAATAPAGALVWRRPLNPTNAPIGALVSLSDTNEPILSQTPTRARTDRHQPPQENAPYASSELPRNDSAGAPPVTYRRLHG